MTARVVLATRNAKKLAELRRILEPEVPGIEVLGLDDVAPFAEPAETEATFEGNALIKARAALAATGEICLADDSGICVDALNGMPGVLSARWSGAGDQENNRLLLAQIADVPDERRGAKFVAVVALCAPGGIEHTVRGEMPGHVLRAESGTGGFGYDPLFQAFGKSVSNGELPAEEKDQISHRGQALRAILPTLLDLLR